ncbi:MAG: hypothetical protein WBV82_13315 [Myxococcaceae bacterium]
MSALLASTVAGVYAGLVVGAHRFNVWRLRTAAGGFRALERLDWESLLLGLLPAQSGGPVDGIPDELPSGAPTPALLRAPLPEEAEPRRRLLLQLVVGPTREIDEAAFRDAGFTGGEARWLATLSLVRYDPDRALERLEHARPTSAQELYLREYLRLRFRTNALNLEFAVFGAKRRLAQALLRFGDQPCLYFARALASSLIGFNRAAIDDLARAVYFSRQMPFYVRAVLDTSFLQEARPELVFQCSHSLSCPPYAAPNKV